jgi:hypothetical protein
VEGRSLGGLHVALDSCGHCPPSVWHGLQTLDFRVRRLLHVVVVGWDYASLMPYVFMVPLIPIARVISHPSTHTSLLVYQRIANGAIIMHTQKEEIQEGTPGSP